MNTVSTATIFLLIGLTGCLVSSSAVHSHQDSGVSATHFDPSSFKHISDEDAASVENIKHHMKTDFSYFKTIDEVHAFLAKVNQLVQKHPKNLPYAQDDLKELHKFLSKEEVTKLVRVDTEPFIMPLADDKIPFAQRAIDDDELTRKLFGGPLRSLVEARKQQNSRSEDGNHKDGNFFSNFWCKISGGCSS